MDSLDTTDMSGRVTDVTGLIVEAVGPPCRIGDLCHIEGGALSDPIPAEVVGLRHRKILLMPLGHTTDIGTDSRVTASGGGFTIPVGVDLLGRIVDACARPLDGGPPIIGEQRRSVCADAPPPLRRAPVRVPLSLGVRAIDALLTCARGQRLGIYAGPGVGKTTLMGMMARNADADVTVVALIGERGREVNHLCYDVLGAEALEHAVVVIATSDASALLRVKAAMAATTIAEFFRDLGKHVLLVMDSLTRVAWAQREVGLAAGEPPTRNGFTPSVFALLPRLLERAGTSSNGTITAFYTVLLEDDDLTGPVADVSRATLDGHIVLSRDLAARNHFP
ncbi:MAG: FliI/YscN family ATPase, partial [Armatimonadota bacterium]